MVNAHDVMPHLKPGTIVTSGRSVIMVVDDGSRECEFVNIHNGRKDYYHQWFDNSVDCELYENMEDYIQAHYDERKGEHV